ncbi:DUF2752 domain-containing protein [Cyclobacterium jeungdonense]|uniref:DUF2752 domain-containing protein n=1 Tax=Cyclobacterium jeungdonense TaxID=708087 RepID=A0ABT8C8N5_9BACT|nr:DUF2752 domain-containing protein [Cyclobacterium jeungdonense]MDN3689104.1 DUF2752 domain-containing protein [Cyclobacterium jeungdonense]
MQRTPTGILEFLIWTIALVGLYFSGIADGQHHSLCPLANLGISWCPGCGLGRSMHDFMHGAFQASWGWHPFGGFALLVIMWRQFELLLFIKKQIKRWQTY